MNRVIKVIFLTGFFVGTTDILSAIISRQVDTGIFPITMFNAIGGAILGLERSMAGGNWTALLGLICHYSISLVFTAFFFILLPKFKWMQVNRYAIGMFYGVLVSCTMKFLVLPLTKLPVGGEFQLMNGFMEWVSLGVIFGIPIAFSAYRYYGITDVSDNQSSMEWLILTIGIALFMNFFANTQGISKLVFNQIENKKMTTVQTQKNKEVIRDLYENILNNRRLELLKDIVSPDFVGPVGSRGAEGFAAAVQSVISGFPDIKWSVDDIVAEDDKVSVRWHWTGTNVAPFRGIPPSNKIVTDNAIAIYQVKDGKILASWLQSDRLGVLTQIGVIATDLVPGLANPGSASK